MGQELGMIKEKDNERCEPFCLRRVTVAIDVENSTFSVEKTKTLLQGIAGFGSYEKNIARRSRSS